MMARDLETLSGKRARKALTRLRRLNCTCFLHKGLKQAISWQGFNVTLHSMFSGLTVSKYSCSTTGCGICFGCGSCGTGCLDYNSQPTSYDIEVTCQTTGNHVDDFGSATLTVSIVQNPVPTINLDGKTSSLLDYI